MGISHIFQNSFQVLDIQMSVCGFSYVLVFVNLADPSVANVQVTRLTLMCETAPAPLTLDLQGELRLHVLLKCPYYGL